jgi:hypothetical protein
LRTRRLSKKFYRKIFGRKKRRSREISELSTSAIHQAVLRASAGFRDLKITIDKYQRRSFLIFPLLIGPVRVVNWIVYRRDKNTYGTLDEKNAWAVRAMNSSNLLLGRTLIVTAVKPR